MAALKQKVMAKCFLNSTILDYCSETIFGYGQDGNGYKLEKLNWGDVFIC